MDDLKHIYATKGYDLNIVDEILTIYRTYQKRVLGALTVHHVVPVSMGGSDHDKNRLPIPRKKHNAVHDLFENRVTTDKIRMILDQDKNVLNRDFIRGVDETLRAHEKKGHVFLNGVWQ